MVVQHEHPQLGRSRRELLLDPPVSSAADLTVVEVGLGRVDGDDGGAALSEHGAALADQLLEMHVADVAGIVVSRHDHQ